MWTESAGCRLSGSTDRQRAVEWIKGLSVDEMPPRPVPAAGPWGSRPDVRPSAGDQNRDFKAQQGESRHEQEPPPGAVLQHDEHIAGIF